MRKSLRSPSNVDVRQANRWAVALRELLARMERL